MTVLEHLRQILAESIEPQLAECGVHLTVDRSGYTIARDAGSKTNFEREVTVLRVPACMPDSQHFDQH